MSSSSQSSDGGINDPIPIEFIMHRGALDTLRELGYFNLEMPLAGVTSISRYKPEDYPLVTLEVKDQDQMDSLTRMKQLQHENILGVHFFDEDTHKNCVRAYIEPYTGCLTDLFHPVFFFNRDTKMFPSQQFQRMVSVSLNALDHIIKSGLYHGNFSWNTTVYVNREDGEKILKLANFESIKNKSLLECQVADCHALGHSLDEVSLYVGNDYANCKPETCLFMDDLARRLKAISMGSLSRMKEQNENHLFFWDVKRIRTFYAYEIPAAWDKPAFLQSFKQSPSAPTMPWNTPWKNDPFLKEMQDYRRANGIREYNFDELNDFLRFISGLYTHRMELKSLHNTLEKAVHQRHPRLLWDLHVATEVADDMD